MLRKSLFSILVTLPALYSCHENHEVEIAVCCINDFHASFVADEDRNIYGVGSVMHTLDSIKSANPYHVVVSAGDNFGGSYFYKVTKGAAMPTFLGEAGIHISAIGNHEFDDGQSKLTEKWSAYTDAQTPYPITYISANLRDSLGNTPHFAKAFTLSEIKLSDTKSITLSFIGLTTAYTPQQTSLKHVADLHFDAEYKKVIDSLKATPEYREIASSVDATFLVTHIGAHSVDDQAQWEDISTSQLSEIDKKCVDGIFTGHTHDTLAAFINKDKIPIVQAGCNGAYIGVMKIKFDTVNNVITSIIMPEICAVRNAQKPTSRTQEMVDALLDTTYVSGRPLSENLCTINAEMPHLRLQRFGCSEVADIVCASYATAYTATRAESLPVIGMSHYGSIRASLYPGALSVLEAGEILPFANNLRAYRYTGKELKKLITFGLNNKKFGWLQTHALTYECTFDTEFQVNKVYYTTLYGATQEIKDKDECVIVVDEYMVTGGDGYTPSFFPKSREVNISLPTTTSAFFNYLKANASFESNPDKMKKVIIDGNAYRTLEDIKN